MTAEMEFNTVDGFQGREVDILVLSTVRAEEPCSTEHRISSRNIGFVADVRRMNVALTRAKLSLWILGNARTLMANNNWEALVNDAKKRNLVISIKKPYDSIFKSIWNKNPSLESSDYHSIQLNHAEKVIEVGWHAEQQKKSANSSYERKRKCRDAIALKNIVGGEEHTFPSLMEADKVNRRKGKSENGLSAKKYLGPVVMDSSVNKTAKEVKSTIAGQITGNKNRGKMSSEKQLDVGNSNMGDGNRDANDEARVSNQFGNPKDAIKKRKQQRDAVDALLSSALISSKKSETSVKSVPVKRSISPTNTTGRSIKPPKPRKG